MAFAAARMLKDKKDQENRKRSTGISRSTSRTMNKNAQSSRSPSISSSRSGSSVFSSGKPGAKLPPGRSAVKCVKRKQNKRGGPDRVDLLVLIDLSVHNLEDEQVAEYKEVFMLFDKDQDGVLSFAELGIAMKALGQRPSEKILLKMVRSVSEDKLYDTIEFNEFLQMMSKQQEDDINMEALVEAFKVFDKDKDGFLSTDELRKIMKERMSKKDLNTMIKEADSDNDGFINCQEFCSILCAEVTSKGKKKKSKDNANRIKEESERNDSSRSDSVKTLSKG
eukprot:TRINITY_DN12196_c0_g1_i3.p1 TRINITY_DN12196_c0_g1~~TRINITY_DN12196_c0_g1_i3.p1  ORF type:complete len:280 (+),score=99.00 TRINITY_DN12196_c0_g1_i3:33-872(+)